MTLNLPFLELRILAFPCPSKALELAQVFPLHSPTHSLPRTLGQCPLFFLGLKNLASQSLGAWC